MFEWTTQLDSLLSGRNNRIHGPRSQRLQFIRNLFKTLLPRSFSSHSTSVFHLIQMSPQRRAQFEKELMRDMRYDLAGRAGGPNFSPEVSQSRHLRFHNPLFWQNYGYIPHGKCLKRKAEEIEKLNPSLTLINPKRLKKDPVTKRECDEHKFWSFTNLAYLYQERLKPCSGRDEMCLSVLNDDWASHPTWASEDSGFVAHRKNIYEESLHRIEEERHDYDFNIEANAKVIQLLEPIGQQILTLNDDERLHFRMPLGLGGQSQAIYKRVLKKIYGAEKGPEVAADLFKDPCSVLPIVLARLKQKDEEWRFTQVSLLICHL